jgi:solute carrier family 35 (UDP-galactose transporter), member B1
MICWQRCALYDTGLAELRQSRDFCHQLNRASLLPFQDEIHRKYTATTALHTMCWMNFWCGLYYGVYLFGATSIGVDMIQFCAAHREAGTYLLLFCLCGAVGQLFIFFSIRRFGTLVTTIVTTTRKFFNILLSVLWLGTPLLAQQWAAVAMVFSGLLCSTIVKSRRRPLKQE